MLDQEHANVRWQRGQRVEDLGRLARRNACHRLVEEQHPRPACDGNGDLQEAPLAVRKLTDPAMHDVGR